MIASSANAAETAGAVALLVNEPDNAIVAAGITKALRSPLPLVRAASARVANARKLTALLPTLRSTLQGETDVTAAAEMATAAVMLGESDLAALLAVSDRFGKRLDLAISEGVARRGGAMAIDNYITTLRSRAVPSNYFLMALWGRWELLIPTTSRILGLGDESGWSMLLDATRRSGVTAPANILVASLSSRSSAIRGATIWFLVRGYSLDPARIPAALKGAIQATGEVEAISMSEEFARELFRRLTGASPREESRWVDWLETGEGQSSVLIDNDVEKLFSARERQARLKGRPGSPGKSLRGTIPSIELPGSPYYVPAPLPAGLAGDVLRETRCQGQWMGLAGTVVDSSGRVQSVDVSKVSTDERCRIALSTLFRLSLAETTSFRSQLKSEHVVVKASGASLCLDAASPESQSGETTPLMVGGAVKAPVSTRRVDPIFPDDARKAMKGASVSVVAECVITRAGCLRNIQLIQQSPFPSINGAVILALSQWKFKPGTLNGKPVDVLFELTVNFKSGF